MERTISHHWIRQLSCVCVFLQGYITSARIIKHELLTKYCCHHDISHKIVSDRTINLITSSAMFSYGIDQSFHVLLYTEAPVLTGCWSALMNIQLCC